MPKIVDHDARRDELVAVAQRVIARGGLLNATTREIAREAGQSHGAHAHYFADKEAIVRAARRRMFEEVAARLNRRLAGLSGLAALRATLHDVLPTDEVDRQTARFELAVWEQSLGDPEAAEDGRAFLEGWRALLLDLVADAMSRGELPAVREASAAVDALAGLVDGVCAGAALAPDIYPPERQRQIVDAVLRGFGADLGKARQHHLRATD